MTLKTLNERNTEAVEVVIRRQNETILEQQKRVDAMNTALADALNRIAALELRAAQDKALSAGHGPTGRR